MVYKLKILFSFYVLFTVILIACKKDDSKTEYIEDNNRSNQKLEKDNSNQKDKSKSENKSENNLNSKQDYSNKNNRINTLTPEAVISPLEARNYNGKVVTVKGFVADVYQSEKVAYLNFVEKYPDNPFTAVIFARKFPDFPDIAKYKNKNVAVTGTVSFYKGKPQIICNSPNQIVIE